MPLTLTTKSSCCRTTSCASSSVTVWAKSAFRASWGNKRGNRGVSRLHRCHLSRDTGEISPQKNLRVILIQHYVNLYSSTQVSTGVSVCVNVEHCIWNKDKPLTHSGVLLAAFGPNTWGGGGRQCCEGSAWRRPAPRRRSAVSAQTPDLQDKSAPELLKFTRLRCKC